MPSSSHRLRSVDWLRGGATVAMIQCHALCLLRPELREGAFFKLVSWLDGFVAPAFFIAAGFSLALVQVRARGAASRATRSAFRIAQVLAVQVALTSLWWNVLEEPQWLLRIDVLSCIGLSLALLLIPVTLLARRPQLLSILALGSAVALLFFTPALAHVTGPLAPLLSTSTGSVFPLAPWGAHLLLGVALGARVAIDAASFSSTLRRLAILAVALAAAAWGLDPYLPAHDLFATPAAHLERWFEVSLALSLLLQLEARSPPSGWTTQRIEMLSRCSLSAYALHEVWIYTPRLGFCFHDAFGDRSSWPAYGLETFALVALTTAACWGIDWSSQRLATWRSRRSPGPSASVQTALTP